MTNPVILLIEDEPADVLLTQRAIRKSNIPADVTILVDGLEAMGYLFNEEDLHAAPSLVLLDLHLPRVSGLHILQRIRQDDRTRALPVVVVSSSELTEDREQSQAFGANSYVDKPLTPAKMINIVESLGLDSLVPRGNG
jgi:two-component system, response regulator